MSPAWILTSPSRSRLMETIALGAGVVGCRGGELARDLQALLGGIERTVDVAGRHVGVDEHVEHGRAAALQLGIVGRRFGELVDGLADRVEDGADGSTRMPATTLEIAGDIEDELVDGDLGGGEAALGARLLGLASLGGRLGDAAVCCSASCLALDGDGALLFGHHPLLLGVGALAVGIDHLEQRRSRQGR